MNLRIRELIDECTEWITGTIDGDVEYFYKEKFAELIVSDCLEQIFQAIPDTDCSASGHYRTARLAAVSRVKQHFGVEL